MSEEPTEEQLGFPHILAEHKETIVGIEQEMQSYSDALALLTAVQNDEDIPEHLAMAKLGINLGHNRAATIDMKLSDIPKDKLLDLLSMTVNSHADLMRRHVDAGVVTMRSMQSMLQAAVEGQS
jgi:hypothetical protein